MKYVVVSGGVISGIGKGIIASSTGLLLKTLGLKVSSIKVDPYLNPDAGTMAPTEHGEVFVLDDGGEVDLDLGNYERYLNITLTKDNNITTGKVYMQVIEAERRGDYLGKTVQVVPHITDKIQDWIARVASIPVDDTNEEPDICIVELGGTVGDIESAPFIEAVRQLKRRAGKNNFLQIHVSLVPLVNGEQKTKPTQQAIRDVRGAGLQPDLIACRCEEKLEPSTINKIANFCQVDLEQVIAVHNLPSTYHVPKLLEEQGLMTQLREILRLDLLTPSPSLTSSGQAIWRSWQDLTSAQTRIFDSVSIALVGKYNNPNESYSSVIKSLEHAAMHTRRKLNWFFIDAGLLETDKRDSDPAGHHNAWKKLCEADGVLVPGGFGHRGTEGMMLAAKWAREKKKPYLGICLGMQLAVCEYARNVCGISDANSAEFVKDTPSPLIISMPEIDQVNLGGTMRLGLRPTEFQPGSDWSKLRSLYGLEQTSILERHRHRFEVNPEYIQQLEKGGLNFIGKDDKGVRMEIVEIKDHPWYVGVQFHPEYLSRVLAPSKPYLGFVAAAAGCLEQAVREVREMDGKMGPIRTSAIPKTQVKAVNEGLVNGGDVQNKP